MKPEPQRAIRAWIRSAPEASCAVSHTFLGPRQASPLWLASCEEASGGFSADCTVWSTVSPGTDSEPGSITTSHLDVDRITCLVLLEFRLLQLLDDSSGYHIKPDTF